MDERTIDYRSPRALEGESPTATSVAIVLTALLPLTFAAHVMLRNHQLSLPDPYNNPYTIWSTACLLALPVLALADAILIAAWRRRIARPVVILALILCGL